MQFWVSWNVLRQKHNKDQLRVYAWWWYYNLKLSYHFVALELPFDAIIANQYDSYLDELIEKVYKKDVIKMD